MPKPLRTTSEPPEYMKSVEEDARLRKADAFSVLDDDAIYLYRENERVQLDERGGWSRSYHYSFDDLKSMAARWHVSWDPSGDAMQVLEIAYRLIQAEQRVSRGLRPEDYLELPSLNAKDLQTIRDFEALISKLGLPLVAAYMRLEDKAELRLFLEG